MMSVDAYRTNPHSERKWQAAVVIIVLHFVAGNSVTKVTLLSEILALNSRDRTVCK